MKYVKRFWLLITFVPAILVATIFSICVGAEDESSFAWWEDGVGDVLAEMFNER